MALHTSLVTSQLQRILKSPQRLNLHSDENHGCPPQITKVSTDLPFPLTHVATESVERSASEQLHMHIVMQCVCLVFLTHREVCAGADRFPSIL